MINDIISYRRQGMSFRKIAEKLNSTVGKVHYQWIKNGMTDSSIQIEEEEAAITKEDPQTKDSYLETKLISSEKIFSEWELAPWQIHLLASYFKQDINLNILIFRLYDVTDIIFNGENAHAFYEFQLPIQSKHWTIKGININRSYLTEIGYKINGKTFFPVLRSNATIQQLDNNNLETTTVPSFLREEQPEWRERVSSYSYYEYLDRETKSE
jgi:uncharacterized protein